MDELSVPEMRARIDEQAGEIDVQAIEILRLTKLLKIPHPARDLANECNAIVEAQAEEIERLREDVDVAKTDSAIFLRILADTQQQRNQLQSELAELRRRV